MSYIIAKEDGTFIESAKQEPGPLVQPDSVCGQIDLQALAIPQQATTEVTNGD